MIIEKNMHVKKIDGIRLSLEGLGILVEACSIKTSVLFNLIKNID